MEELSETDTRGSHEVSKETICSQRIPEKTVTDDLVGSANGRSKKKYFGSWDPVNGGMTWQDVDKESDIQLEKDPVTHSITHMSAKRGTKWLFLDHL
jgi:hypothetical protein